MPIEILMPALSPTMTEGNLAKWLVKEGDNIKSGQVLAEIETDKATMEVEAVDEGIMGKIMIPGGTENVKVNALIALLLEEGEDKKLLEGYAPKAGAAAPVAKAEAAPSVQPTAVSTATPVTTANDARVFASPLAKRIAAQENIPLSSIQGSGPHGRIVRADVEAAKNTGGSARGMVRRMAVEATKIPNGNIRKVIARRLTESKQTVPHFYLMVECELDKLLEMRKDLNAAAEADAGKGGKVAYKLSVNDFVIKAVALALKKIPAANASWTDDAILQYNNIDISIAVATPSGLITPIVKNADQKTAMQISSEMKDLAARARDNKLKPEEFQGGGFSISNLGMFGVKNFSAIINPPQGCILAVGAGEERAVVRAGQMAVRNMMDVTLSVDHRVVDGAVGAEFLSAFKKLVEAPGLLLV